MAMTPKEAIARIRRNQINQETSIIRIKKIKIRRRRKK